MLTDLKTSTAFVDLSERFAPFVINSAETASSAIQVDAERLPFFDPDELQGAETLGVK